MLFPLAWFSTTFLLFTAISGKKTRYLLPLLPAAALLVAGFIIRRHLERDGRIREGRPAVMAIAGFGVFISALSAALVLAGPENLPARALAMLSEPGSEAALAAVEGLLDWPGVLRLLAPAALLGAGSMASLKLAIARRGEALTASLISWTAFLALAGGLLTPVVNDVKGAAVLAREIRDTAGEAPLYYIRSTHAGVLNFHLSLDRMPVVNSAEEVRRAALEPGARFIGNREEFMRLRERASLSFTLGPCRRVGGDVLCLGALEPPAS
jgi:hypothetical protein